MGDDLPLAGIHVVDLSTLAPGPYATTLLGDLGADVITVEAPAARRARANVTDIPLHGGRESRRQGINPLYRSRRSIVVDLKHPEGLGVVQLLVDRSDVLIEGFRPGVTERLGLGWHALSVAHPRLVYCSLTGYGQSGPLAVKPGHDLNYLARAGLLAITTRDGGRPGIPMNLVADFAAGGLVAAFGIVAALQGRERTGRGSLVDVSMFEGVLSLLATAESWRRAGAPDPSFAGGLVSGRAPFYDCYRTADGKWLAVGCVEPKFFASLCEALGLPELLPLQHDPASWDELRGALTATFASATRSEWEERLGAVDTAVSPVLELSEAFEEAESLGLVSESLDVVVPRIGGGGERSRRYSHKPGSDTDDVLGELGLDGAAIAALRGAGAVA